MPAIRIRTKIGSTTLSLPELAPLVGHRVELIVRDEGPENWPAGWFEATTGAITDSEFKRALQPPADVRPKLEP